MRNVNALNLIMKKELQRVKNMIKDYSTFKKPYNPIDNREHSDIRQTAKFGIGGYYAKMGDIGNGKVG
jgi:hypothetical protein